METTSETARAAGRRSADDFTRAAGKESPATSACCCAGGFASREASEVEAIRGQGEEQDRLDAVTIRGANRTAIGEAGGEVEKALTFVNSKNQQRPPFTMSEPYASPSSDSMRVVR